MTRSTLRRMVPCIALTIAAHAVLLAVPVRPVGAATGAPIPQTLQLRWLEQPAPPTAEAATESGLQLLAAHLAPLPKPSAALPQTPLIKELAIAPTMPVTQPDLPPLSGLAVGGAADEDDLFVARALLSVPPTPLGPVVLAHPPAFPGVGRFAAELTLFIDETGAVVRVRTEGAALPPMLEDAARNAFMNVRFRPGELAEHGVVKSRIRVEVVFESDVRRRLG